MTSGGRDLFRNPALKVLRAVWEIAAPIAPEAVARHDQRHGRDFPEGMQPFVGDVRATFVCPSPVAAVNAVQQDHNGKIHSVGCAVWGVDGDVAALPESGALECHEPDSVLFKTRIRNLECSKWGFQCAGGVSGLALCEITVVDRAEDKFLRDDGGIH